MWRLDHQISPPSRVHDIELSVPRTKRPASLRARASTACTGRENNSQAATKSTYTMQRIAKPEFLRVSGLSAVLFGDAPVLIGMAEPLMPHQRLPKSAQTCGWNRFFQTPHVRHSLKIIAVVFFVLFPHFLFNFDKIPLWFFLFSFGKISLRGFLFNFVKISLWTFPF